MTDNRVALFNFCATRVNPAMVSVPLGPLYLISCLASAGIIVDFYDYQLFDIDRPNNPASIFQFLKQATSDIIAISCWDHLLASVLLATKQLKEEFPNKRIILGGLGPSGVSSLIIRRFPHVDVVIRGPGEEALPKVIQHINDREILKNIPGVCLGGIGKDPYLTEAYSVLPPINSIPWPAYYKVDLEGYGRIQLVSSRGCPYRCAFCSIPGLWDHKYAFRSVDNFVMEIEFLYHNKGIKRVHMIDDTFAAKRKRVFKFCERIRQSCPELKWTCYSRLDLVDEESCEQMAEAGCDTIYFGVESGSNDILQKLGKRLDTDTAIKATRIAGKYFHIIASFLWGLPYETFEDFGKTIITMYHLSEQCKSIEVQLFFVAPLALSDLRNEFSDHLAFSPNYLPFFTWGGAMEEYGKEVLELVQNNMDMFPGMCYYDSPDLEKKVDLARRLKLLV